MGKLTHTVKGPIASFRSADVAPIESLKLHFLPKQEGSGDPSPNNIRPITGWTGCNFGRINGLSLNITNNVGMEFANGAWKNTQVDSRTKFYSYVQLYKNGTYIKNAANKTIEENGINSLTFSVDDANCNRIVFLHSGASNNMSVKFPFNLPLGTYTLSFNVVSYNPSVVSGLVIKDIFLVPGNNVERTEFPISWSDHGVEYGGYIDPIRGKIVSEYRLYDIGQCNWHKSNAGSYFYASIPSYPYKSGLVMYCSHYKFDDNGYGSKGYYGADGTFRYYYSPNYPYAIDREIYIHDDQYDSASDFQSAMNGVMIAYPLLTPIEYDIDPIALQTFLDYNNFWSDMNDDTEVEYEFADRLSERKLIMDTPHISSTSDAVASFNTDMRANITDLKAHFTPVQEGSGDPSPVNKRPIHGWTGLNIHDEGKNLIDKDALDGTDKIWWKGGITTGFPDHCVTPLIPVKPGASYYLYRKSTNSSGQSNQGYVCYFGKGGRSEYIGQENWQDIGVGNPHVIPDNVYYIGITVGTNYKDTAYLQLNDLPHEYADYVDGTVIPIQFPAMKNIVALDYSPYAAQQNPNATIIKQTTDELEFTTHGNYTYECVRLFYMIPAGTYTAKIYATAVDENDNYSPLLALYASGERTPFAGIRNGQSATFTLEEDTIVDMRFFGNLDDGSQRTVRFSNFQIERGSTATPYEPYGTVYGGYIDLVRNKIVAEWYKWHLTSSDIPSYGGFDGPHTNNDHNRYRLYSNVMSPLPSPGSYGYGTSSVLMCDKFNIQGESYPFENRITFNSNNRILIGIPSEYDTKEKALNWIDSIGGVDIVYKLATPIEYDLTPEQIKALKGQNNIWSDANGNVEVSYWTH